MFLASTASFTVLLAVYTMTLVEVRRRYMTEQRLLDANSRLDLANKQLDAFTHSVSPDLRSPIRHVMGFASMLDQGKLSPDDRVTLSKITEAAGHMRDMVESLLRLSRTSRADMHHDDVDMAVLVHAAIEKAGVDGRVVQWQVHLLPVVKGDQYLLRQVWANLLSNAVKYTAQQKLARVEIGAEHKGPWWEFFVRDNGVGFNMNMAGRLFNVFSRLHGPEFDGVGVGLANVWTIVNRHGGRVWAEAKMNKGATFYFSLPDR